MLRFSHHGIHEILDEWTRVVESGNVFKEGGFGEVKPVVDAGYVEHGDRSRVVVWSAAYMVDRHCRKPVQIKVIA